MGRVLQSYKWVESVFFSPFWRRKVPRGAKDPDGGGRTPKRFDSRVIPTALRRDGRAASDSRGVRGTLDSTQDVRARQGATATFAPLADLVVRIPETGGEAVGSSRLGHESPSRDRRRRSLSSRGDGRDDRQPEGRGPETHSNGTSQGPSPEDGRRRGRIRGCSGIFVEDAGQPSTNCSRSVSRSATCSSSSAASSRQTSCSGPVRISCARERKWSRVRFSISIALS